MTKRNLRDAILAKEDLTEELVEIPEWECTVLVRSLMGDARAELLQNNTHTNGRPDLKKMYPALAIASARDPESGELIFELADRDTLNTKSGAALERIAQVAIRLNHLMPDSVEQARKNS